jgi:hypothetical protein
VQARGADYETVLRTRAANIKLKKEIAAEFEIDPIELGTISKPGDSEVLIQTETETEDETQTGE